MKVPFTFVCFFILFTLNAIADEISVTIVEYKAKGDAKKLGSVEANDDATREAIRKLWDDASKAFSKEHRQQMFGPGSGYIEITLKNGRKTIVVRSWHPVLEKNKKLVVTSRGVEALDGRKRADILKADKAWYQEAKRCFDAITAYVTAKAEQGGETDG